MWRHIVSLRQSHGPKIYYNWRQLLFLKISVTIASVINSIIPNKLQKCYSTLKARLIIATLSSSTLLTHHIYVDHTLKARLTSRYASTHAMKMLRERYSYGINTTINRFRDVRYTLRTRYLMIDTHAYTRSFLDVLMIFPHDIDSFAPHV